MWWSQSCVLKVPVIWYNNNYDKGEQLLNWIFSSLWHVYKCSFGDNVLIFLIKKQPLQVCVRLLK